MNSTKDQKEVDLKMTAVRVLVTEASSPLAYHLLPMIASGDLIQNQRLELVLCDCEDARSAVLDVDQELKDCLYPSLSRVLVTSNFGEACKTADVILVLPSSMGDWSSEGYLSVELYCSILTQIDYGSLNSGLVLHRQSKQDMFTVECRGLMSAARSICSYLEDLPQHSLKTKRETSFCQEAIEFKYPLELESDIVQQMALPPMVDRKSLLLVVNLDTRHASYSPEEVKLDIIEDFSQLPLARL